METIRNGVFETNSSSTHVISIAKSLSFINVDSIPETVEFINGIDFGWSNEVFSSINEKFTYLLLAMDGMSYEDFKRGTDLITKVLQDHNVEHIIYPDITVTTGRLSGEEKEPIVRLNQQDSSLDHSSTFTDELYHKYTYYDDGDYMNAGEFLFDVLKDENSVRRFLLENSWITTGSDNGDGYYLPYKGGAFGFPDDDDEENKKFINAYNELSKDFNLYFKSN